MRSLHQNKAVVTRERATLDTDDSSYSAADWMGVTLLNQSSADDVERELVKSRTRAVLFRQPPIPLRIEHFTIIKRLGAGGMGEVFLAYDEQLGRNVAIKLVRSEFGRRLGVNQRMVREARTLAKLSHPNVVQIYHVGVHEGRVFLAMELIPGRTLRVWLRERRQESSNERALSWRELLETYIAAGRGLAAAHEEGLIHRDFKPDNVLISDKGRVCVVDFGLAGTTYEIDPGKRVDAPRSSAPTQVRAEPRPRDRSTNTAAATPTPGPTKGDQTPSVAATSGNTRSEELPRLTAAGAIMGTPAYMSPEQRSGDVTDTTTDQFSFCVSLYEALYQSHPFGDSKDRQALAERIADGLPARRRRQHKKDAPARVYKVLTRGLAAEPTARYESMNALLNALERTMAPRARYVLGGLTAIAILAVFVLSAGARQPAPCSAVGGTVSAMWNQRVAGELRHVFLETGAPYAADTWSRVRHGIDGYTGELVAMQKQVCEATRVSGEQPQELFVARTVCLDGRQRHVRSLIESLRDADGRAVERSVQALSELPDIESCADGESLMMGVTPPSAERASTVAAIRDTLSRSFIEHRVGHQDAAMGLARQALTAAEAQDYTPVLAEALYRVADVEMDQGVEDVRRRAEQRLFDALDIAESQRHDELAAKLWNALLLLSVQRQTDLSEGHDRARRALAAAQRIHYKKAEAVALGRIGALYWREGKLVQAEDHLRRALALAEHSRMPPLQMSELVQNLANVLAETPEVEEAYALYQRAETLSRSEFGERHPYTAMAMHDFGTFLERRGDLERARDKYQAALAVRLELFGEIHINVALEHMGLANVLLRLGDLERAQTHADQALAIFERVAEAGHPYLGYMYSIIGDIAVQRERPDEALSAYGKALDIQRSRGEPDSRSVGITHTNISHALIAMGRYDDALAQSQRAQDVMDRADGVRAALRALPLLRRGQALVGRGDVVQAIEPLERAHVLLAEEPGYTEQRAEVMWALARALKPSERGADERARALANEAYALYARFGEPGARVQRDIQTWLDSGFSE